MTRTRIVARFALVIVSITCAVILLLLFGPYVLPIKPHKQVQIQLSQEYYKRIGSQRFPHFYMSMANDTIVEHPPWGGEDIVHELNNDGFNSLQNFDIEKPADVFRIVTMGDSFTFGMFVPTQHSYPEVLRAKLTSSCGMHFEVLNLGTPGYDVGYAAERYYRQGEKYKPDLIIWLMNSFNMSALTEVRTAYEEEFQKTMTQQIITDKAKKGTYYYPGVLAWNKMMQLRSLHAMVGDETTYLHEFGNRVKTPIIIVPIAWVKGWPLMTRFILQSFAMHRADTYIFTGIPPLADIGGALPDSHPNKVGHTYIAEHTFTFMKEQNVIPCNGSSVHIQP